MLMKILLTALVIMGAVLVLRRRMRQVQQPATMPHPPQRSMAAGSRLPYVVAYGLVALMLGGAGFFIYMQWQDSYQVVSIRVIDSRSGKAVRYEARRGDVEGRSFRTLDGRVVTLADVERMELGGE